MKDRYWRNLEARTAIMARCGGAVNGDRSL